MLILAGVGQLSASAADLYVATNGTAAGPGGLAQPYNLATALSGQVGRPGDTFWLRGGTYELGHIDTTIQGAKGQPITFRQLPGERARVDGSITFFESAGYVTLWGFELFSSDTNRVSRNAGQGLNPTDLNLRAGLAVYVPNMQFINLIIHDHVRHGIYISDDDTNAVVHGCIAYNNGWQSVDNADGHNYYMQNTSGTKVLSDNMAFNSTANNFQIYTDHDQSALVGVRFDGNVAFNAGILTTNNRRFRDYIVGVDAPAIQTDRVTFINNMGYYQAGSRTIAQVQIGRDGVNGSVVVSNNYLPLGFVMNNWKTATVMSNLIAPRTSDYIINLNQGLAVLTSTLWDKNTLSRPLTGADLRYNFQTLSFLAWTTATGFDAQSSYKVGGLTGTKVFVRPNKYEAGRAHIIVYNWDKTNTVAADMSSVMAIGAVYEVRNAQDPFSPPVLVGTYDGMPLPLPMTGQSVAKPNGNLVAPAATGPEFNAFLLLPRFNATKPSAVTLQMLRREGYVELSWPTNAGNFILQSRADCSPASAWSSLTNTPTIVGTQYMVTNETTMGMRFYRLKSQ